MLIISANIKSHFRVQAEITHGTWECSLYKNEGIHVGSLLSLLEESLDKLVKFTTDPNERSSIHSFFDNVWFMLLD